MLGLILFIIINIYLYRNRNKIIIILQNIYDKNLVIQFLVNVYRNVPLLVISISIILTTYIVYFFLAYTNLFFEGYNYLLTFSIETSYAKWDEFLFERHIEKNDAREFFDKSDTVREGYRSENCLEKSLNIKTFILSSKIVKLFLLEYSKLKNLFIDFYTELLFNVYDYIIKIIKYIRSCIPGRSKEQHGCTSAEWYYYVYGRMYTILNEHNYIDLLRAGWKKQRDRELQVLQNIKALLYVEYIPYKRIRWLLTLSNKSKYWKNGIIIEDLINYLLSEESAIKIYTKWKYGDEYFSRKCFLEKPRTDFWDWFDDNIFIKKRLNDAYILNLLKNEIDSNNKISDEKLLLKKSIKKILLILDKEIDLIDVIDVKKKEHQLYYQLNLYLQKKKIDIQFELFLPVIFLLKCWNITTKDFARFDSMQIFGYVLWTATSFF